MGRSCFHPAIAAFCLLGGAHPAAAGDIFPYPVHQRSLANGLRVVVVPYDSPGTVAYLSVVRTGSRDEVEPGKSGFAHFFEHMMFRGTERYSQDAYNEVLKRMGADSNAFTDDDLTCYYIIGPARELATMMDLEADRFQNLEYDEPGFRAEALAVRGEYDKSASGPSLPMWERLSELAFTRHTYGHTTIGYREDIDAMPDQYEYSLAFFDRYYRPENVVLVVVGDVQPEQVFAAATNAYGPWQPGYQAPAVPSEPAQSESKESHIDWPSPILPHLLVGFRAPAFSDSTPDTAALDVIAQLLFAESAPLYQDLVVDKQWVDSLSGGYQDHRDPYLFSVFARVRSGELVPQVLAAVHAAIAELQRTPVEEERLERIKSHLRYGFATRLDTPGAVGFSLARYIALTADPMSVNRVYDQYAAISPADVQRTASAVLVRTAETIVTLSHPEQAAAGDESEGRSPR
ncbi:MAG: M16 family metallopeptidase [Thermoanaerobaculia bacterium]